MKEKILNPYWRLNHLYKIVNKRGEKIVFKLNHAQKELYDNLWYCNIILKARQLGISTFVCMLFLDRCLFNANVSAGIIAHTREDAEAIFKRIKTAYDNLPSDIKDIRSATVDSARELCFSNGSSLRVGTSMRGSTLQYLHISEFGKICAKYPDKAEEIISGSLNTVAPGQYVFIESTAEGREGRFYDMCKTAQENVGKDLSQLEYRFHFFPWYIDPAYRIGSPIQMHTAQHEYFASLKSLNISLEVEQKYWYCLTESIQGENMLREYPSTPEEAWQQSTEGCYYAKQMQYARQEGRIGFVPHDKKLPVHTAWDLGYNDQTSIWFFQVYNKEIRLIEYIEGSGESLSHWLSVVKSKPYIYEKHLAPHDIMVHEFTSGMTRQATARMMGFNLVPVPKVEIISGIDAVRGLLDRCFFNETKCASGIQALENYKKEWNDKMGTWRASPHHDANSHCADAFRTLATGIHFITGRQTQAEIERDRLNALKDASGSLPGSIFYDNGQVRRSSF
jgi:hypothetical protein